MGVNRLVSAIALYFRLVAASSREQLAYRADVLIGVTAFTFYTCVEALGLWVMFDRFGSVDGWELPEVGLVYGIATSSCGLAECLSLGFRRFDEQVRRGEFDRLLLRPRATALQMFGCKVSLRALGRVVQGAGVIALAWYHLELGWSLVVASYLVWIVTGAVGLFLGVFVLQATAAFWTVEALEVFNVLSYGGVTAAQYPLTIYAPWFRKFFTYVLPLALVCYFPILPLLQRQDPLGSQVWQQYLSPVGGLVFLACSLLVWTFGVRKYRSTGS